MHVKSLDMPESSPKKEDKAVPSEAAPTQVPAPVEAPDVTVTADQSLAMDGVQSTSIAENRSAEELTSTTVAPQDKGKGTKSEPTEPWPTTFNAALTPFLSEEAISQLKTMFLEGPEPPRVSDGGWGARPPTNPDSVESSSAPDPPPDEPPSDKQARGRRGRERGARGARGGGRGGRAGGQQREDTRKVLSNVRAFKPCLLPLTLNVNLTLHVNSLWRTRLPAPRCIRL